jgi:hypothetical protein
MCFKWNAEENIICCKETVNDDVDSVHLALVYKRTAGRELHINEVRSKLYFTIII